MNATTNRRAAGFTLVELMVVAIIVAILAAVAIPLMAGNKKRAMGTEAETALGAIRTQLRVMYAETGNYTTNQNGVTVDNIWLVPGVLQSDLTGKYWSTNAYQFKSGGKPSDLSGTNFILEARGSLGARDSAIQDVVITMDAFGTITRTGM
jgi:prepilin-type N-terminal cleavage/methylation domain-containing protein